MTVVDVSDADAFAEKAESILNQVYDELGWMYETKHTIGKGIIQHMVWSDIFICPECGNELVFNKVASDPNTGKVNKEFKCPHCGTELTKKKMSHAVESSYDKALDAPIEMAKKFETKMDQVMEVNQDDGE